MNRTSEDRGGRTTIVIGGTGGLGTAIVRELLASGHRVAVIADAEAALSDVSDLIASGSIAHAIADVRDRAALEAAANQFERAGFVANGVVANAGVVARDLLLDAPDSEIRRVLDTNLYGTIATLQTTDFEGRVAARTWT